MNALTGLNFKLPTEAQWEYAARGGNLSKGYKYSGSNNLGEVGWYGCNSGTYTHRLGEKQPNELGLYDMSGNVWEWCEDWSRVYSVTPQRDPLGAAGGSTGCTGAVAGTTKPGAVACRFVATTRLTTVTSTSASG